VRTFLHGTTGKEKERKNKAAGLEHFDAPPRHRSMIIAFPYLETNYLGQDTRSNERGKRERKRERERGREKNGETRATTSDRADGRFDSSKLERAGNRRESRRREKEWREWAQMNKKES